MISRLRNSPLKRSGNGLIWVLVAFVLAGIALASMLNLVLAILEAMGR